MQATYYRIPAERRILNGRDVGTSLRQQILHYMQQNGLDRLYYIDFAEVEFLDFSCADELVRGLLDELTGSEGGPRNIVLHGTSQPVQENIAAVLELRKAVCLIENGRGNVDALGPLSVPLRETLQLVIRNKQVTARDVADHFKVAINTASNRLTTLSELGLILRTGKRPVAGGGEENMFESLV
jgi:hypothetical protein